MRKKGRACSRWKNLYSAAHLRCQRFQTFTKNLTVGYVLVPLFAGTGKNDSIENAVESEKFDVVADVVNALQEHDEELVDIIREIL